jgi:hypothetical protein
VAISVRRDKEAASAYITSALMPEPPEVSSSSSTLSQIRGALLPVLHLAYGKDAVDIMSEQELMIALFEGVLDDDFAGASISERSSVIIDGGRRLTFALSSEGIF